MENFPLRMIRGSSALTTLRNTFCGFHHVVFRHNFSPFKIPFMLGLGGRVLGGGLGNVTHGQILFLCHFEIGGMLLHAIHIDEKSAYIGHGRRRNSSHIWKNQCLRKCPDFTA